MGLLLRDKMLDDLRLKGFSENTQRCYIRCARHFAEHYRCSPMRLGEVQIRDFLLHLIKDKGASPATHRMYVASLSGPRRISWTNLPMTDTLPCHGLEYESRWHTSYVG